MSELLSVSKYSSIFEIQNKKITDTKETTIPIDQIHKMPLLFRQ